MANPKVPLRFQIFRGNDFIGEELISEPVIKVGKLASSHLKLEDDTISRMHAVIEVNGADDIQVIDLGSTHGTVVNGEKVARTKVAPGAEITFGALRVVISLANEDATKVSAPIAVQSMAAQTAPPPVAPPPVRVAPPVQAAPAYAPPPAYAPAPAPFAAAPAAPPMPPGFSSGPAYAQPAYANPSAGFAGDGGNALMAEAEEPGSQAVEVQALFRGVVTHTRHLSEPGARENTGSAKALTFAGVACVALSMASLVYMQGSLGREKELYEEHLKAEKDPNKFNWQHRSSAGDVPFLGGALAGMILVYMGLKRWGSSSKIFTIGSGSGVDAPIGSEFVSGSMNLVSPAGADFAVHITPQMTGEIVTAGQTIPLQQYVQQRGSSFPVPQDGRIRIDAGQAQFFVASTPKPRVLPVPFLLWSWAEQKYTVGSLVALMMFLLMIFAVPPDPKSLSLDLLNADDRFVNFLIKPPEEKEEEIPEWLKKKGADEQGGKGKAHKGDEGKMGKKTSKNKQGLYALKGPQDNPDPHLAKKLAEEEAKNAGILGVLKSNEGSHLASIFGRDTALGSDAENVLGGLLGSEIGEAYGGGGLGLAGTGSGGGGTGEGTIGLGNLGTIGKGGGGGSGSGYGRGAGGLHGRRARSPEVMPGTAAVRGSLDKEIIRRIIRRHINEVKFCYEQELVKSPELQGRIAVNFTIAATGQVVASVMQDSTLSNRRVESCVVAAVRRWEFPKPNGGGIVIVTYPFVFNPAGGG
ncbi:MAG: TonB family protein [Deltaproteobacteria bacterium]|nr:TonB family protein [Deltaproteobacteria bacterium]